MRVKWSESWIINMRCRLEAHFPDNYWYGWLAVLSQISKKANRRGTFILHCKPSHPTAILKSLYSQTIIIHGNHQHSYRRAVEEQQQKKQVLTRTSVLLKGQPISFLRRPGSDRYKRRNKVTQCKYIHDFLFQTGGGSCAKHMINVRNSPKMYPR